VQVSTEHQRIARISRLFARSSPAISLGIGDDCAVLAQSDSARVWTVDAAIENVHFVRGMMRDEEIGYRALMAAASDVAAMGARATGILCALALPSTFSDPELDAVLHGYAEAADLLHCPVVGGNLTRASELSITTTVIGDAMAPIIRGGALVDQGVFVTGPVGGAALGLTALRAGQAREGAYAECIARFLRPRARLDLASLIGEHASAAIDISDGLAQDLGHLCAASGVGARITLPMIPRPRELEALAHALGQDAAELLLSSGEEYELLFTADVARLPGGLATQIGVVTRATELCFLDAAGALVSPRSGFDHFG
jgi:thiamine-monophosphate kinase